MAEKSGNTNESGNSLDEVAILESSGDGRLVSFLRTALDKTITKFLGTVTCSLFKEKYIEIYEKNPEALKDIYEQLLSQLQSNIRDEVNKMCEEENVAALLDSLDELTLQNLNKKGQIAWRPSGYPADDLRDHTYDMKVQHKQLLENSLSKLNSENELLLKSVELQHEEIFKIKEFNEELMRDFKKTVELLTTDFRQLEDILCNIIESEIS